MRTSEKALPLRSADQLSPPDLTSAMHLPLSRLVPSRDTRVGTNRETPSAWESSQAGRKKKVVADSGQLPRHGRDQNDKREIQKSFNLESGCHKGPKGPKGPLVPL